MGGASIMAGMHSDRSVVDEIVSMDEVDP
jgi:hypothetical protein